MTRERNTAAGRLARSAVLPAFALAAAAHAQAPGSVEDYRLPPASPAPTPSAAGPVDSDHPVAAPTTSTSPTPSPTAVAPTPTAILPPTRPATRPTAAPVPRTEPPQAAPGGPAPEASSAVPVPQPTALEPGFETLPNAATPAPELAPAPAEARSFWPWAAGGAAFVLLLGGFLLWRRKRAAELLEEYEPEPPAKVQPQPQHSPRATLTPPHLGPKPAASPAPPAPPQPVAPALPPATHGPRTLEMHLEARHLSRAMVNATLAYRLSLTNRTDAALGPLRIAGDITSAHASLSAQEQLSLNSGNLAALHEALSLAPGETLAFAGELRLPLASILPMNSGGARVFVPLARFRVESGSEIVATRVFVVGQAGGPGSALRPFALDRGPGVDRTLGQRELEIPA